MDTLAMDIHARGGPYRPNHQSAGEIPTKKGDIPVCAVLLALFIPLGVAHFVVFIRNMKRHHKFIFSQMCFGLTFIRTVTFSLRIAWACHPTNIKLGIASGIFVYAGTVLLFAANLFFTQRVLRAQHQRFGWTKPVAIFFPACVLLIIIALCTLVSAVTDSFFTLNHNVQRIDRDLELTFQTVYAVMSFIPIPILFLSCLAGRLPSVRASRKITPVDNFGTGSMRTKIALIIFPAALLTLELAFRAGSSYKPEVPSRTQTGAVVPQKWYYSKAAFYAFNFAVEFIVSFTWLICRFDQVFWVPNGAKGSYAEPEPNEKEKRLSGAGAQNDGLVEDSDEEGGRELVLFAFGPTTASSWV